jgi:hypothetical protein
MKKLFLTTVLSTLLFSAKGQLPLDSFYRKGATWCEYSRLSVGGLGQGEYVSYNATLYTGNDTTINGLNYHSLWCDYDIMSTKLIGGLRVDASKVYFYKLDTLDGPSFARFHKNILGYLPWYTDTLLYDFNLKLGDSLAWKGGPDKKVIKIDSVQAAKGVFIKRFYFKKDAVHDEYWLEGSGSNFGLYMPGTGYPPRNISYHYNDIIVFNPNSYNYAYVCFPTSIDHIDKGEGEILLYPNPLIGNELEINTPATIALLTITDISGSIKYSWQKFSSGKHNLNVFLEAGVYFINVQFEDGTIINRKLVKL